MIPSRPLDSLVCLTAVFLVVISVCQGCPTPSNATEQELLENNASLKELVNYFVEHNGKLSSTGLRQFVEQLHILTVCPWSKLKDLNERRNSGEYHSSENVIEDDNHSLEEHNHDASYQGNHDDHEHDHVERNMASLRSTIGKNEEQEGSAFGKEQCKLGIEAAISRINVLQEEETEFGPSTLLHVCPAILISLIDSPCDTSDAEGGNHLKGEDAGKGYHHHNHDHHHRKGKRDSSRMTRDAWIGAVLSMVLIGLIALACIMVIPILKRSKYYVMVNHFLLALAVGSLGGDALIHLLPHALTMEIDSGMNAHLIHALYGFTAFVGILLFLLMERVHNMVGHKHSHGHSHVLMDERDEKLSAELNEVPQHTDKILEKHNSFIYSDPATPAEIRGCFESCPPNLGPPGSEDANGNNGVNAVVCKPRITDHNSSSAAECERLVAVHFDKTDETHAIKATVPIAAPPLLQNSPPKPIVRQDSNNFNMVLQEYHVGHHGHSHHGHSHVTGKKDSLRTMILLGDGMHTFMDGMAIGAAYGTSLTGGIATSIAVLCHELPHKVGDFAILFEMGMKRNQALKMVVILWLLSLAGLAVGVSIGSIHEVSPWIYCFTAGVFLYLALVDLLSELSINGNETCSAASQMMLQVAGMVTGSLIMLVIAIYEHNLEELLEDFL